LKGGITIKLPKGFRTFGHPLKQYQYQAFLFGIERRNSGLLLFLGSGKTRVSIDTTRYRLQFENANKALIVAPVSVLYHWQNEIQKYSEYDSIVLYGSREERLEKLKQDKKFYIINYEALRNLLPELLELQPDIVIADESARYIKNQNTFRTKSLVKIADRAKFKQIITATPIPNFPMDVWPQFRMLDGGETFSTNFYKFRNFFFRQERYGGWTKWVLKKEKLDLFSKMIYASCIRIRREDVGKEHIPTEYKTLSIPLEEPLKSLYQKVQTQTISEIETSKSIEILTIENILTKLLRLQQITSGFIKNRGEEVKLKYTPKLDAAIDIITSILEAGESVIIWCRFIFSIKLIANELDKLQFQYITMYGKDTGKRKYDKWREFQNSLEKNIFLGQIESGGLGIELFKTSTKATYQHMLFYENVWSLDTREQATGRIERTGQTARCRFIDLLVKDTIDEKIINSIKQKKEIVDLILEKGIKGFLQ
jgi:SNF2 family DNA or RNA helicase